MGVPTPTQAKKGSPVLLQIVLISQLCMHLAANHDAFTRREREPAQFSTDAWTGQGTVSQRDMDGKSGPRVTDNQNVNMHVVPTRTAPHAKTTKGARSKERATKKLPEWALQNHGRASYITKNAVDKAAIYNPPPPIWPGRIPMYHHARNFMPLTPKKTPGEKTQDPCPFSSFLPNLSTRRWHPSSSSF